MIKPEHFEDPSFAVSNIGNCWRYCFGQVRKGSELGEVFDLLNGTQPQPVLGKRSPCADVRSSLQSIYGSDMFFLFPFVYQIDWVIRFSREHWLKFLYQANAV
jgi:hypothetical protein